jgi:hypothetical protein
VDRGLGDFTETRGQSDGQPHDQENPHRWRNIPTCALPRNTTAYTDRSQAILEATVASWLHGRAVERWRDEPGSCCHPENQGGLISSPPRAPVAGFADR